MSDETFVLMGTPLPPIKKTDAFGEPKKPNPTRDLEVRDEQGRRRFHGAFTGGYSAGYYNTVGSKEGWTPSEFVSSRNNRSEKRMTRPEDFMDEEDKQMLLDASRLVATDDFDILGSTQRELEKKRAAARNMQASGGVLGVLPDTLIDDFIVPSSEPVGIRLLKRMGWKPGQGIGPRVSKRQRKPKEGHVSDDEADIPANVTFAPIDSAIVVFSNKSNQQGLGFDPYKNAPEFDKSLQKQSESKYLSTSRTKKTGFGFGTFDDDDEDDDVYSSGPTHMRALGSDILLDDEPNIHRKGRRRDDYDTSQPETTSMYCSDGRSPLHGFILATTSTQKLRWYSAPKVPRDFVPHHTFDDDVKPIRHISHQEQPKLTADDRALVLGETPIDAPKRSVFEYMSAENKSRLDNILGFVMDKDGEKHMRKDHFVVPKIEKSSAEAALKGFMPFGDNIPKQNRYKQYLNIQAGNSEEKIGLVDGFSGEDMTKELNEFVQAARIFKPMTSSMANRFTSASSIVEFAQPMAGLRTAEDIKTAEKTAPIHAAVERMEVPKSQAAKAAAMGMFGPLTRTTVDFYPSKLLCKRFNVPNPHPDHKDSGPETAKDLLDKATMEHMMMNRGPREGMVIEDKAMAHGQKDSSPAPVQDTGVGEGAGAEEAKQEQQDEEVMERPPMDIFKAIFDDSDSDSDSDSDLDDGKTKTKAEAITNEASLETAEAHKPDVPFRPMFTKKSERSNVFPSTSATAIQGRSSKIDVVRWQDNEEAEGEEEDESEIGPRLSLPKPATATVKRSAKIKPMSVPTPALANRTPSLAPESVNINISSVESPSTSSAPAQDRISSPDDDGDDDNMIGPPAPVKHRMADSDSDRDSTADEPGPSSSRLDSSSKKRKSSSHRSSSHKESSSRRNHSTSRSERNDRRHRSTSRSRRRRHHDSQDDSEHEASDVDRRERQKESSKKKSHRLSGDEGNVDESKDKDKGKRSRDTESRRRHDHSSSRSKSKRHREHRSRSKSKSPSRSHKRDKDRDRDHDRSSKRSRSEKRKSKHRDRHRENEDDDIDMEGMWIEKEIEAPTIAPPSSTPESKRPFVPPPNRPRADAFF
ncbi:hypothetical protein BG011_003976 [Mortierella polycephala]|uniref:G-patch domain-containing protein n=1 Tax=Mortierella polycephala TaxID=41804 RepID=A0A9P6QF87_9FUNG|nr:hypothetical protein BG011_003976 [Mortierella polycephala]